LAPTTLENSITLWEKKYGGDGSKLLHKYGPSFGNTNMHQTYNNHTGSECKIKVKDPTFGMQPGGIDH
jgi:hypothetical protein